VITVRPARERLQTRIDWLDSRHTFTFDEHIDPRFMGFRAIRVLNEDRVAPAHGFGTQPHRDLEILTWVVGGALRHEDSLGTRSIVKAGDLQCLSAGTGVLHSEFNASDSAPLHLLQVWIAPVRQRLAPAYQQRTFAAAARHGRLVLIASADGRNGSVRVNQDVAIYTASIAARQALTHYSAADRHIWVQVTRGSVQLNGVDLRAGDGAAIENVETLQLSALSAAEALLFDLA
jgi:redox-sensitive bicupin YhaK (pirin superfamily)